MKTTFTRREIQIAAAVFDLAVESIKYEDGTSVTVVKTVNPYRRALEIYDGSEQFTPEQFTPEQFTVLLPDGAL